MLAALIERPQSAPYFLSPQRRPRGRRTCRSCRPSTLIFSLPSRASSRAARPPRDKTALRGGVFAYFFRCRKK